ncbi:MAG: beta-hexosaminidase, partial [Firmicutes bacterium]|nr:beta-hexosaminidase [Bacillota bacterium]
DGYAYPNVTTLPDDLADLLGRRGFGGVILFSENTESVGQTTLLIHQLQTANASGPNPGQLLIGVDQEGGIITRLATGTKISGNMGLSATGDPANARAAGTILGQELKAMGFNFDLAPVVDVNSNPSNPVINLRSFSDDPETVARFGKAFMEGLHLSGVAASLKHFPGHGNTSTDSHTGLPCVYGTYEELAGKDMLPFKACAEAGVDAIMTAHIQYPDIEMNTYASFSTGQQIYVPATLSRTIITDILRGEMGFDGVVITDAMNMDAVAVNFGQRDSARLALNAGVDIILMPVNVVDKSGIEKLESYIHDVAAMVDTGEIDPAMVDAAVRRVLTMKYNLGLLEPYDGSDIDARVKAAESNVGCVTHHAKEWEVAKDTFTLIKNENSTLPLTREGETTVILVPRDSLVLSAQYALDKLAEDGKTPAGTVKIVSYDGAGWRMISDSEGADNVVVLSRSWYQGNLNPWNSDGADSGNIDRLIDSVHQRGGRVIVLSCYLPYDAARFPKADAIGICYGAGTISEDPRVVDYKVSFTPNIPAALYMMFDGTDSPTGVLPVDIPALNSDYSYSGTALYERGFGLTYGR